MTDLDLDRLRALADAATTGPWHADHMNVIGTVAGWWSPIRYDAHRVDHDAAFIAAARTAVPDLLDRLTAAEAEVERLRCDHCGRLDCDWTGDILRARAEMKDAEIKRLREMVSLALGVIDLDMKLHAPSASTAGCGGGIGGQMITPHCPDYCDHPKHDADKARREDLLNSLYRARIAETAPEPCLCAGHYMACDEPCPDFWLPDVPMSPDKGHAETAPEDES